MISGSKATAKTNDRNYGIDLLRLVSMFFVVVLHSFGKSGIINNSLGSKSYFLVLFVYYFCYSAVDIFALISGFVGYRETKRPFKIKGFLKLWIPAVFYSLLILFLARFFRDEPITGKELVKNAMPIMHSNYWYLKSYFVLFFLMPIINAGVRSLDEKQCKRGIIVCLVLFCATRLFVNDLFLVSDGYSAWWLAILYFIGAAMKKSGFLEKINRRWCLFGILLCTAITWAFVIFSNTMTILDFERGNHTLSSYISPTIVIAAMLFLRLFSSFDIKRNYSKKLIRFAAPCAFSVYLINSNPYVYGVLLPEWLAPMAKERFLLSVLKLVGFSLLFFVIAVFIEKIRQITVAFLNKEILAGKRKKAD